MEVEQSYKRPRVYTGLDGSLPSSSLPPTFQFPFGEPGFTPSLFDVQVPPQATVETYGLASGFQNQNSQLEHSRKRRKLDKYIAMSHDRPSPSGERYSAKRQASPQYGQYEREQAPPWPQWAEASGTLSQAVQSPLASWVMDLGLMICPNCTTSRRQSDGYQSLSEAPEMAFDPASPYITDKQPSMQMPVSGDGYDPAPAASAHRNSFCCNQTSMTPDNVGVGPVQNSLSLSAPAPAGSYQQAPSAPAPAYYSDQLVDPEPQYTRQTTYGLAPAPGTDQSPVQYGPSLIDMSCSPPIPQQGPVSNDGLPNYTLIPDCGLADTVSPDGWDVPLYDQYSGGFDILLPNQRGGKRGPFKDPNLREQTAQTRKIGSCIRCRMQRIRCEHNPDEPGGPCLTCKKVTSTKTGRFPCLRYKITDIRLYKPGQVPGFEWTRRWDNNISDPVQQWASDEMKTIRISDGYSKKFIELRVRQFVPQEGDKLARTWDYKGTKKSVKIPPFALMDLDGGKEAYTRHIDSSITETFHKVLGRPDGLLYKTYARAWRLFKDPSTPSDTLELLELTMKLWMSVRLSTTSGFIVGNETLGMPADILDETSSNPGKIPMPPVLGAQLDLILIQHIQTKLRRELLDKLQKTILKNKHSTWFVTYLVTFILLHNSALITAHDANYARKHGMKRRFAREDKVIEYHLGANILLAHFHYCNKGAHPFSDECRDLDLQSRAELNDDELQFVRATRSYAKRHKREWETLRDECSYEDDYYFVSQLFEDNWQPRPGP